MVLTVNITRKVLFEKFDVNHKIEDILLNNLEGCILKTHHDWPGSIFFIKNDEILFEIYKHYKTFWIKRKTVIKYFVFHINEDENEFLEKAIIILRKFIKSLNIKSMNDNIDNIETYKAAFCDIFKTDTLDERVSIEGREYPHI